ncbi:MAG: trypsin-like peptidase domain-containing protein [Candidatus Sungbacteria bacterium]|uniref:Trypsin-like peptidase domain-containing protein n=1 Tax=Candidatus Sungiibacteriota bacterium TaxID=2750080 RepID=A0A9D6LT19_9BACT|nr:trypsin-like peptidase domain-containing protein [Candidatus Sungbacteria bacterium]
MPIEKISRTQFLALVAIVAFSAAAGGGIFAFSYVLKNAGTSHSIIGSIPSFANDEAVVQAVAEASPAVVSIVESKDVPIIEQYGVSPFGNDPFFRQFFGDLQIPQYRQKGTTKQTVASGTGFIVSQDGMIVTNKHVVPDANADYTVFMNDGSTLSAKVLARDPIEDLAILKINKSGLATLKLGDSSRLKIGQTAIAIGNSLGEFSNTVSVGVISGLRRNVTAYAGALGGGEDLSELIQTDAAINPGNSGGPLLNIEGEVIGINTAIVEGAESIGFSIPASKAQHDIDSIKKSGKIIYPYMGVRYVSLNRDLEAQSKLPTANGAWLFAADSSSAVLPSSPAEKAGLKTGDIIIQVNSDEIDANHSLAQLLEKYSAGDVIALSYLRDGARKTTNLTLVERPQ